MSELDMLIARHELAPHPEGGYYRERYRSEARVRTSYGERSALTMIHFALERSNFSALHRLKSDETWHFITGAPIVVETIAPDGTHVAHALSARGAHDLVVRAGTLFGAHVDDEPGYALVACCVAPGFEFADFELPSRAELLAAFPAHAAVIERLTRA